jgi:undecaprenyl-diphosphatase
VPLCLAGVAAALLVAWRLDHPVLRWVLDVRTPWLDRSVLAVTHLGDFASLFPVSVAVVVLVARRTRRARPPLVVAVGLLLTQGLVDLLKAWIARPRPSVATALQHLTTPSMPSGHATMAMAVLGCATAEVLCRVDSEQARRRAVAVVGGLLILAVGASRVYLGVHWCSDVVAGWCLGVVGLAAITELSGAGWASLRCWGRARRR